jgi:hypothetical protein
LTERFIGHLFSGVALEDTLDHLLERSAMVDGLAISAVT